MLSLFEIPSVWWGVLAITSVIVYRHFHVYNFFRLWNWSLASIRERQNAHLQRLAAADTSQSIFGKVPGCIPANLCTGELEWASRMNAELIAHRKEIAAEILKVGQTYDGVPFGDLDPFQQNQGFGRLQRWRAIWIYFLGSYTAISREFPVLTQILSKYQQHLGLVTFSSLGSQHIPPHVGAMFNVLRYHLMLIPPQQGEDYGMRIQNHPFKWQIGQGVIFDDCCEHESWNHHATPRIIVFMDILRPMSWPWNYLNKLVYFGLRHTWQIRSIQNRFARAGIHLDT